MSGFPIGYRSIQLYDVMDVKQQAKCSLLVKPARGHCPEGEGAIDLHRSISVILNGLDLNLPSPHLRECGILYQ